MVKEFGRISISVCHAYIHTYRLPVDGWAVIFCNIKEMGGQIYIPVLQMAKLTVRGAFLY